MLRICKSARSSIVMMICVYVFNSNCIDGFADASSVVVCGGARFDSKQL